MIRGWLTLIALLAGTLHASAFSPMQADDCAAVWRTVIKDKYASGAHRVSRDGWCQVSIFTGNPIDRIAGMSIDQIEWRAEGIKRVIEKTLPPTALAIRLTDSDMPRALGVDVKADAPAVPAQITLVLREDAKQRQVRVEGLTIDGPKGNTLTLSGTFHDVDLSSFATMQISLGSAKLRDVIVVATGNRKLEPYLRPYIGTTFPERSRRRSSMIDKVAGWPEHSFPPATKRAVKQLIASLPAPHGTMRIQLDTGPGLSAATLVQGVLFKASALTLANRILGATIFHATWTAE